MRPPRSIKEGVALLFKLSSPLEKRLALGRGPLGIDRGALPDFLGIGAQKAGTTWLDHNLRCHPDLFLPANKELHYFDWYFHVPLAWYVRQFRGAAEPVRGEITPNYSTLPERRIAFLHELRPDLKLIMLLRNPVRRAWSHAVMEVVTRRGKSIDDVPDAAFRRHFRSEGSRRRGDYLGNLQRWERVFPAGHVFIGFYESIAQQPRKLLADIFRFLGVSADVDWKRFPLDEVIHGGAGVPLPERLREDLEGLYRDDLERLHDRFGETVEDWRVAPR